MPIRYYIHNNQRLEFKIQKSHVPIFSAKTIVRTVRSHLSSNFNKHSLRTFKNQILMSYLIGFDMYNDSETNFQQSNCCTFNHAIIRFSDIVFHNQTHTMIRYIL